SIAASTQSIFERLCTALDLRPLLADDRFATNQARVRNYKELDEIVGAALGKLTLVELSETFARHEVGFSPIYDIADVFDDPQFKARRAIVFVPDSELGTVRMQGVVPRFSETPGEVRRVGPTLGEHNEEIYGGLGLTAAEIAGLKARKVI
ncbi:MAG: CoA transferase, partial [Reyranellales bacterium]